MGSFRFGIFAQLILSFVLAVMITLIAAGVGIFSIQKFNKGIEEVALSRLPAMALAYQLGQQSEAIVASAPMLVRANTHAQRETISFRIADRVRWLQEIVDSLKEYNVDGNVIQVIDVTRKQLLENFDRLDRLVQERIDIERQKKLRNEELQKLIGIGDDANQNARSDRAWVYGLDRLLERLLVFQSETDLVQLDKSKLVIVDELRALKELSKTTPNAVIRNFNEQLHKIALGENGLLTLQSRQKSAYQRIVGILAVNERLSSRFVYSVNDLIRRMREEIEEDSTEFQQLVEDRTSLLTMIVLACVVGASLIGMVVIRRILRRLKALKRSMRIHAEGGETDIPLEGEDEISDMGDALKYLVDEIARRQNDIKMSEMRFRDAAEATSDWFWETDRNLNFSLISDRFYEITGFQRDEIIGQNRLEFKSSSGSEVDDPEKWEQHQNDLKNRRRFRDFTYSLKCSDGFWRQIKISGKPIFKNDGEFIGYRGTGSDVTSETQARSRLMAANEIMPGAFALWDHENRLVVCNRKYYQYYKILSDRIRPGVTFEELVMQLEERNGIRDNAGYAERRRKFRQKPTGVFMEALSDGRYLQVSEAPTLDSGTVSLIIDITDRIEAEARLEQARLEAENANKAKSKFLAAASHDLRQPLHAIGMFLSALEDRRQKAGTDNSDGDLRIISNISDSLEALRGLLNALLDISKLDAGVMKAEFSSVMLQPLVKRLQKQYESRAKEKGLKLNTFCPNIAVRSDPVLLERVLSNLMSNAIRYTQEGGVLLGIRRRGDNILIQIADTGVGIPEDKTEEIFVEFQQLDNPARDRRRGLGLGLAIVERVLGLLGHTLDVRSVLGQGSLFSLSVPCDHVQDIEKSEKPIEVALSGGEVPLIVVIDDEPDILDGMEHLILGWKYDVIAAVSAQEAMAALETRNKIPSLILADYRLQDNQTGAGAIKLIHEKIGVEIPAAIITGDTAPDRIQEAKASGFILLHKPLRPAKLRQLIRSVQAKSFLAHQRGEK